MRRQTRVGCSLKLCLFLALTQAVAHVAEAADNIDFGPFHLTTGLTAGLEYDDNANTSETHPQSDEYFLIGPFVNGNITLPIVLPGGQQMSSQLGLAYTWKESLTGKTSSTFTAPLSVSLLLPMYFSAWTVVAADNFTFQNSPVETTFGYNRTTAPTYNNTASLSATRQFGRFAMTLASQRTDIWAPQDVSLAETDYSFSVTPAWFLREDVSVFLRNSYGLVYPEDPTRQLVSFWSSEVGIAGVITPSLTGSLSIGFAHDHFQNDTLAGAGNGIFGGIFDRTTEAATDLDGITSTIGLSYTHPLRPNTTYSLSFVRTPGVTAVLRNSSATQVTGVTLSITDKLTPNVTLQPLISFQDLQDVGSSIGTGSNEHADLLTISMGVYRQFGPKTTGSINYLRTQRTSNLMNASYDDDQITIGVAYTF